MECLQLRTINLQAFKRTKPVQKGQWGAPGGSGHSLLEGRSWGQGEIAETACLERSLGSIKSWDLDFSTTVQI